ncbi:unnamed protein product [Cylicocyclus nassatus]|uniref:Uncharacterized protein n=1 Tax=Cylicocyclus nassatus TaxID=53992 RepID=A0AA36DSF3_CYLNA|nr:unnamed protein product [Cylicocyclus nassatus]
MIRTVPSANIGFVFRRRRLRALLQGTPPCALSEQNIFITWNRFLIAKTAEAEKSKLYPASVMIWTQSLPMAKCR